MGEVRTTLSPSTHSTFLAVSLAMALAPWALTVTISLMTGLWEADRSGQEGVRRWRTLWRSWIVVWKTYILETKYIHR